MKELKMITAFIDHFRRSELGCNVLPTSGSLDPTSLDWMLEQHGNSIKYSLQIVHYGYFNTYSSTQLLCVHNISHLHIIILNFIFFYNIIC